MRRHCERAELTAPVQDRPRAEILRGPAVAVRQDHGLAHPALRPAAAGDDRAAALGDGRGDGERAVRGRSPSERPPLE